MSQRLILGICLALITLTCPVFAQSSQPNIAQKPSKDVTNVLHQALLAAQQITDPPYKSITLQNLASLLIQAGDPDSAKNIQQLLTDRSAKDQVTYYFAYFAASNGKLAEALSIAHRISGENLRDQCFGAISGLRAADGDLAGARDALNSIQNPSARANELDSDLTVFADKLSKTNLDSLIALAIKNISEIPDKDSRMVWLLRTAIVQKKAGHLEDSARNLRTVRDAVMNDDITKTNFYNMATDLASALVEAGHSSDAILLADKMPSHGGKENILYTITCSQAKTGDIPAAKNTLRFMDTEANRVGALECLGAAQAELGDFQGARETAARISQEPHQTLGPGVKDGAYKLVLGLIAIAEAKGGKPNDALDGTDKLSTPDQVKALVTFGLRPGDDGHPNCDKSAFDLAFSVATAEPHSKNDFLIVDALDDVVDDVAIAQTDCKLWHEALTSASALKASYVRPMAMQYLAYWQTRSGDSEGALSWANAETDASSRASAFMGIAEALLKTDPPYPRPIEGIG